MPLVSDAFDYSFNDTAILGVIFFLLRRNNKTTFYSKIDKFI